MDLKISQLPITTTISGSDLVLIDQNVGGTLTTKTTTVSTLLSSFVPSLGNTTVNGYLTVNGPLTATTISSNSITSSNFTALGDINFDGFKGINVADGTNPNDAVNFGQLTSLAGGITYLNPILVSVLIDDSLTTPPASPVAGRGYIAAATAGGWVAGHLYVRDDTNTSWVDITGAPLNVGDRLGVNLEDMVTPSGGLTGHNHQIATVVSNTPGSFTYSFYTPIASDAAYVNGNYIDLGHLYYFNGTLWIDLLGGATLNPLAGVGLVYNGNTLNVTGVPVTSGGTGASSLSTGLLLGNGASAITSIGVGTNGQVATSNGTTVTWVTPSTPPTLIEPYADATGTSDSITASYSGASSTLIDGYRLTIGIASLNTTTTPTFAPTLSGVLQTARTIVKFIGGTQVPLAIGDLQGDADVRYDLPNTKWILMNPGIPPANRTVSTTNTATLVVNVDTTDFSEITALAQALTISAPTGTAINGQTFMIRLKDNGTVAAIAFNTIFATGGVTLPTTTVAGKWLHLGFIYNSTITKWQLIGSAQE